MTRAVFLDRDGVINRALVIEGRPFPPSGVEELELLPRVAEAIERLKRAGFRLIIVTNQPDVATGRQRREVVEAMHERLRREILIDDIKVCYHSDQDACACRKPQPGMLLESAAEWALDLKRSFMIGDRWRDIEAGQAVGCKTILIRYEYDERQADKPDAIVNSLFEASELILSGKI
jgi:D-glycero-D-manno-heptose 1,7-bisphosphate phosphatase